MEHMMMALLMGARLGFYGPVLSNKTALWPYVTENVLDIVAPQFSRDERLGMDIGFTAEPTDIIDDTGLRVIDQFGRPQPILKEHLIYRGSFFIGIEKGISEHISASAGAKYNPVTKLEPYVSFQVRFLGKWKARDWSVKD